MNVKDILQSKLNLQLFQFKQTKKNYKKFKKRN